LTILGCYDYLRFLDKSSTQVQDSQPLITMLILAVEARCSPFVHLSFLLWVEAQLSAQKGVPAVGSNSLQEIQAIQFTINRRHSSLHFTHHLLLLPLNSLGFSKCSKVLQWKFISSLFLCCSSSRILLFSLFLFHVNQKPLPSSITQSTPKNTADFLLSLVYLVFGKRIDKGRDKRKKKKI
jgi:hypothetical protein